MGETDSSSFPVLNAIQATNTEGYTGTITELNFGDITTVVFSTYWGVGGTTSVNGVAVDSVNNNIYVGAFTESSSFSTTTGAFQTTSHGGFEGYVSELHWDGESSLTNVYTTLLGGSGDDSVIGLALDSSFNVYVTGYTSSSNFPTMNPIQATNNAGENSTAFVTELNPTGTALIYSTYLGGSGGEQGNGIAVDSLGNAYVSGFTYSSDFPIVNAYQSTCPNCDPGEGEGDAFVAEISPTLAPAASFSPPGGLAFGNENVGATSAAMTETVTNPGSANLFITNVTITGTNAGDFAISTDGCSDSTVHFQTDSSCRVSVTFTPSIVGNESALLNFTDNATGSPQSLPLTGTGVGGATASLSTTGLTFANQAVTTTSAAQTVTVTNTGSSNLIISTAALGGTNASAFATSSDTCTGATVAPAGTCAVRVTFTPAATGALSGTLTFTDNSGGGQPIADARVKRALVTSGGSTQVVTLSGTGVDFGLAPASSGGSQTVVQGASAAYTIDVSPLGGTDSNTVTLACSGLPAQAACSFATNPVTPGASGGSSALTISTAAPVYARMVPPSHRLPPPTLPGLLVATMLLAMLGWRQVRRTSPRWAAATCLLFGLLFATAFMTGCGAGGYPLPKVGGTPAGSYSVTVTGTSGSTSHSTTVTLTVTAS